MTLNQAQRGIYINKEDEISQNLLSRLDGAQHIFHLKELLFLTCKYLYRLLYVGSTLFVDSKLQAMMKDPFGNYVVQKVLETCDDQSLQLILSRIRVHFNTLKRYTYGKHIVSRVEKLIAAGGKEHSLSSYQKEKLCCYQFLHTCDVMLIFTSVVFRKTYRIVILARHIPSNLICRN